MLGLPAAETDSHVFRLLTPAALAVVRIFLETKVIAFALPKVTVKLELLPTYCHGPSVPESIRSDVKSVPPPPALGTRFKA